MFALSSLMKAEIPIAQLFKTAFNTIIMLSYQFGILRNVLLSSSTCEIFLPLYQTNFNNNHENSNITVLIMDYLTLVLLQMVNFSFPTPHKRKTAVWAARLGTLGVYHEI